MERHTKLDPKFINRKASLPYELTINEVSKAVSETYRLFNGLNNFLTTSGFRPLEELLLGNSLSGILSEFLVKNIARVSHSLVANLKVGGHPDLLPKGHYNSNLILKGNEGIEVKSSIQKGGWQGHNPEDCWLLVFRYIVGKQDDDRVVPLTFVEILCAKLTILDCCFQVSCTGGSMSRAAQFRSELDRLFRRRTHWLRTALDGAKPGAPPQFRKTHVKKLIEKLQDLASDALANSLARDEFEQGISLKKSWHVKRGKGRGYDEKRRVFKIWFEENVESLSCIYVFWYKRSCIYVGKTLTGASRPSSYFDKAWFLPVTRVDVYSTTGRRVLPALECLAIHSFQPKQNRFRAAAHKWTKRCSLCFVHKLIKEELQSIFRLR